MDHINSAKMDGERDQPVVQTSVPTNGAGSVPQIEVYTAHGGDGDGQTVVLVELLRQVSTLRSEETEQIMRFFVRLGEICDLGLVVDREFITRIMPLVSGSLLKVLGDCLH